jgi:hypothetical protein
MNYVRFAPLMGRICVLVLLMLAVVPVGAQGGKPTTPAAGSAERKAIMDALRVPVEKKLKQKVIFKVNHLKVLNGWAHLRGQPLQPNSKPINYRGTEWQEAIENGAFDDGVYALLRKKSGKWKVVTFNIGATDVVWDTWDEDYGAPLAIFR